MNHTQAPVNIHERIVVSGMRERHAEAFVKSVDYLVNEARWKIVLSWPNTPGGADTSVIYDTDEGKVWYRYAKAS